MPSPGLVRPPSRREAWWAGSEDWPRGRPGPRGWRRRRGFGCLFGLIFLLVVGSVVAASGFVLTHFGPLPWLIVLTVVLVTLTRLGRALRSTGTALDELVEATRRVEAGDYSVRVGPHEGVRAVRQLARGFDTMAARLETDERQRRTLLAEVSHELRTPLAVVQGNLEAILDGVYPADPAHLDPILEETRVLGRLIDDLRTLALSEAGTLGLHPEPTDPDVLVGDVVRSFELTASAAGVDLVVAIEGDLPILEVDPVRIREILANLVANALRHTPPGGRVTVAGGLDVDGWVRLEVRDTGRGIEPTLLPHVFDRFVKGDDSRGSGLGLAIARQLVVAHGGEIVAESVPGQGTTIRVRLPLTGG
ncbi:MAG TPA: HAMP domain-containing sensor histidine kinase [Candidatus Limnocylindrales bacterium]|nr:HAMP domain-containing sensor histidine kinase [Candidatus Limnocylindrales bacterium]